MKQFFKILEMLNAVHVKIVSPLALILPKFPTFYFQLDGKA
jgi:hypothetical protein